MENLYFKILSIMKTANDNGTCAIHKSFDILGVDEKIIDEALISLYHKGYYKGVKIFTEGYIQGPKLMSPVVTPLGIRYLELNS